MSILITSIEQELPATARHLGLGRTVVAEAQQRARDLAARLRVLQIWLLHEPGVDAYQQVRTDVATLVTDVVRGTWAAGPAESAAGRAQSALARFGCKVGAAASLLAVAGGLPYIPRANARLPSGYFKSRSTAAIPRRDFQDRCRQVGGCCGSAAPSFTCQPVRGRRDDLIDPPGQLLAVATAAGASNSSNDGRFTPLEAARGRE